MKASRQVAGTVFANGLLALCGLLTGAMAARVLGPEERGQLAALQMWPILLAGFAALGLPEAIVYLSARNPARAGMYLYSSVALSLAAALPLMCIGYLLMPVLLRAQSQDIVAGARWYLFLIPIQAMIGLAPHPLRGINRMAAWNAIRFVPVAAWIGVLLVAQTKPSIGAVDLAVAQMCVLAVLSLPLLMAVNRRLMPPYLAVRRAVPKLLRYALPCALSGIPQGLKLRLDQILMAAALDPRDLGLYIVALAWSGAVSPILAAIGVVLLPRIASERGSGARIELFCRCARITFVLAILGGTAAALLSPVAIRLLFGSGYLPAVPGSMALAFAAAIAGFNQVLEDGLRGLGRPSTVLAAETAGLLVSASMLYVLLPKFGTMGAAFATLIAHSAVAIGICFSAVRSLGIGAIDLLVPTGQDVRACLQVLTTALPGRSTRIVDA